MTQTYQPLQRQRSEHPAQTKPGPVLPTNVANKPTPAQTVVPTQPLPSAKPSNTAGAQQVAQQAVAAVQDF